MPASASGTLAYCGVVPMLEWRAVDAEGMAVITPVIRTTARGGETARGFLDRCVSAITDMVTAATTKG